MKTISGDCVSSKQVSLSKAAKILSKFVSAENGASQVINAYLHRASDSFNELKQVHKQLESSSHSHKKKNKRRRTEETHEDSENNQELNHEDVPSKNRVKRRRLDSEKADHDDAKSTQIDVKSSQELNGSIGSHVGNVGRREKHKKNKRKQEV